MDCRDAIVELRESGEQLINVHVLRAVNGRKPKEDIFVVSPAPAWRARAIDYENAVSEPATHRCLELMVVRVDKAWHRNAASRIDLTRAAPGSQVRPDCKDLLALDEDIGLREVADIRI